MEIEDDWALVIQKLNKPGEFADYGDNLWDRVVNGRPTIIARRARANTLELKFGAIELSNQNNYKF